MQLPFFFEEELQSSASFELSEATSKHAIQVLRLKQGDEMLLTNGNGQLQKVSIISADKKKAFVKTSEVKNSQPALSKISIAISLIKNANRFEWFLEKATEIGVAEIIPVICERTEKVKLKTERIKNILVSAMLQSRQAWLPQLKEPIKFNDLMNASINYDQKFIAHCIDDNEKKELNSRVKKTASSKIILIGPEGDFTKEEVNAAKEKNFIPVNIGNTRLRTETAALVAAALLINN